MEWINTCTRSPVIISRTETKGAHGSQARDGNFASCMSAYVGNNQVHVVVTLSKVRVTILRRGGGSPCRSSIPTTPEDIK